MMETSIHQEGMLKSVFYPPLKVWRLINGLEFPSAECSSFLTSARLDGLDSDRAEYSFCLYLFVALDTSYKTSKPSYDCVYFYVTTIFFSLAVTLSVIFFCQNIDSVLTYTWTECCCCIDLHLVSLSLICC